MSILTQSGRAAIAASIKEQSLHLAWGTGDAGWESSHKVEKTFVKGEIKLDHHTIKDVKAFTGQTVYQLGTDYIVEAVLVLFSAQKTAPLRQVVQSL